MTEVLENMEKKMKYLIAFFLFLSAVTAAVTFYWKSFWLIPMIIILIFLFVAVMPFCRKRENLWLFVLGMYSLFPVNIILLKDTNFANYVLFEPFCNMKIFNFIMVLVVSAIVMSIESILVGLLGRIFWKRQYKLPFPDYVEDDSDYDE